MTAARDRSWPAVLAAILLVMAVVSIRVALEAKREIASAQDCEQREDFRGAIDHYRRALRWAFPLSPFEADAVKGLTRIAQAKEAAGDIPSALLAWRSLLGGVASTRSLVSPTPAEVERARTEIARLLVRAQTAERSGSAEMTDASIRAAELDSWIAPAPLWGGLLLVGFALWLASLVALIRRGFDEAGHPRWPAARAPLLAALAGFGSFVLGLIFA